MDLDLRRWHRSANGSIRVIGYGKGIQCPFGVQGDGRIGGIAGSDGIRGATAIGSGVPSRKRRPRFHQATAIGGYGQIDAVGLDLSCWPSSAGRSIPIIGHRIGIERPTSVQRHCRIDAIVRARGIRRSTAVWSRVPTCES